MYLRIIFFALLTVPQVVPTTVKIPPVFDLQPQEEETDIIARRFNYFDLELLREFSETPENVLISPASIKSTLAMILEGARGTCAKEIGFALRIDNIDEKEIRKQLGRLLFDLNDKSPNTDLQSSNAVFVSDKYNIVGSYEKKVAAEYKALVRRLNFDKVSEAVAAINGWASNATGGLIQEIITPGILTSDATIVIANALFFKGKWKIAFDSKGTRLNCFYTFTRGCVMTPTMQIGDFFNYNFITDLNAHAIELPYQDDKYSMLILIPGVGNNYQVLARDMQHANFGTIVDVLKPTELIFEMPKFEIEYSSNLNYYLGQLKIREIFGTRANLTGIVSESNVRINNMIHKTKIEVDENGTKAAAASAAVVIPLMGSSALRIVADRPFIFFIYHKESKNIIFEGIFVEPKLNAVPAPQTRTAERFHNFDRRTYGQRRF